jgi:hypothetical protein
MQPTLFPLNEILPAMLTKKQLRQWLGGIQPISHKTLKRRLIKDGILIRAQITWPEISSEQYLPPQLTRVIIEVYHITKI